MRALCCTTAILALLASPVLAADKDGRAAVRGAGQLSCKQAMDICNKDKNQCAAIDSWLNGFISGINVSGKDLYDLVFFTPFSIISVLQVCKQKPDLPVANAVDLLVRELAPLSVPTASKPIDFGEGKERFQVYQSTVRAVQQELINRGFLSGKADGTYGPGTKAALQKFQDSIKLPATGMPDPDTVVQLLRSSPGRQGQAAKPAKPAAQAPSTAAPLQLPSQPLQLQPAN